MEIKNFLLSKYRNMIIKGELEIGTQMPSQRELARKEGISKSVANAIYKELEEEGLLETQERSNTFVSNWKDRPNEKTITSILQSAGESSPSEELIKDFEEFRIINECKCAALAAQHRTDDDIRKLYDALDKIVKAENAEEFANAHLEFHLMIFSASHNSIFSSVAKRFAKVFYNWGLSNYSNDMNDLSEMLRKVCIHIENRDAVHAEALMNMYSYETSIILNINPDR